MLRKRQAFIEKFGPELGPKLYHALQSQAAHAGVSARLRRKLHAIERGEPWPPARPEAAVAESFPLFPDAGRDEPVDVAAVGPDPEPSTA